MGRLHALISILFVGPVVALDNGLAITPPMGWRSWNCYHGDVTQRLIEKVANAMTAKTRKVGGKSVSIADVGYNHLGTDDGWQQCDAGRQISGKNLPNNGTSFHAPDGTPLINHTKFPDLRALVKYGKARGLKMGWYNDNCICMDSYTLQADAVWAEKSYAGDVFLLINAGFDSVKIDNCGDDQGLGFQSRVRYINESGIPMLIENSAQGNGNGPPRGLPNSTSNPGWCPFNLFRTGGDIGPDFNTVIDKLQKTTPFQDIDDPIARPGCWAYPDMLEVGNFVGPNSYNESRTHFGAWCVVSSPLILGFDVTNDTLVDMVWDIIANPEAIAVNQAWAGHPGRLVVSTASFQVWAKKLPNGAQAVLVFNHVDDPIDVKLSLSALGLSSRVSVRDIWAQDDLPSIKDHLEIDGLTSHDSKFYVLSPSKDSPTVGKAIIADAPIGAVALPKVYHESSVPPPSSGPTKWPGWRSLIAADK